MGILGPTTSLGSRYIKALPSEVLSLFAVATHHELLNLTELEYGKDIPQLAINTVLKLWLHSHLGKHHIDSRCRTHMSTWVFFDATSRISSCSALRPYIGFTLSKLSVVFWTLNILSTRIKMGGVRYQSLHKYLRSKNKTFHDEGQYRSPRPNGCQLGKTCYKISAD